MDASSSNGKRAQESGDVATPSAKKQKLGERKSDVAGGDDYLIPLRLTARSGYLAVEEVARLLLFTGKTFMGDIFGDLKNDVRGQCSDADRLIRAGTPNVPFVEDIGPFRYVHNIEVTRNVQTKSFGIDLLSSTGEKLGGIGCKIQRIGALMQSNAVMEEDDVIIGVNEKDVRGWKFSDIIQEISALRGNVQNVSIRRLRPDVKMQMWRCICQHKWRNPKALSHLMSCAGKRCNNGDADWEGLFQKFCSKKKGRLELRGSEYDYLVSVYDSSDDDASLDSAPVACLVIEGKNAYELNKEGKSGWLEFDSPIYIGTFASMEEVRNKINTWSIGLHLIREMDKKTRKVDVQRLDSGSRPLSRAHDDHDYYDSDEDTNIIRNSHYYTRIEEPMSGVAAIGYLSGLMFGANNVRNSKADIEFKRNLQCSVQVRNDGKIECRIEAVSVDALIKNSMNEIERVPFSQHSSVRPNVTLADFLALTDGWV